MTSEDHTAISGSPRVLSLIELGGPKYQSAASVADVRRLDWELKAANKPFYAFDDLLAFCGFPGYTHPCPQ
jgi:hypothetical protein